MSRARPHPVRAKAVWGALALIVVAGLAACEEDSKTAPDRCADPPLPIYDIQAGAPAEKNPCVTPVGHSISMTGPSPSGGTTATTAGTSSGGKGGSGGTVSAGAGAGGAP